MKGVKASELGSGSRHTRQRRHGREDPPREIFYCRMGIESREKDTQPSSKRSVGGTRRQTCCDGR